MDGPRASGVAFAAMRISADARIPFPRPLVFATYRDELANLVPYLPNVRAIEVKSRSDDGAVVKMLNVWHGGGEIPAAARAFVSEAMLSWDDHARWDGEAWTCEWKVVTHAFSEAVSCGGTNRFVDEGDATIVQIRGELSIDAKKVAGVPKLLAGSVSKTVEELLAKKIAPNLVQTADGVRRFLEAAKG